jgi:hypothetical protein
MIIIKNLQGRCTCAMVRLSLKIIYSVCYTRDWKPYLELLSFDDVFNLPSLIFRFLLLLTVDSSFELLLMWRFLEFTADSSFELLLIRRFFELTVNSSFELLLMRRFFPELFLAFGVYNEIEKKCISVINVAAEWQ